MALDSLATTTDLSDRGIDVSDPTLAETMLDVASATVRAAAGSPISQVESTVVLDGWGDKLLPLPGPPVISVSVVEVDGTAVTDYKLTAAGALWRDTGWGCETAPASVEVTQVHGFEEVPADIVDLVCNLANAGQVEAAAMAAGGSFDPRQSVQAIDDYRVEFSQGAEAFASVFDLPQGTRSRLRARFGGSAAVVEYR